MYRYFSLLLLFLIGCRTNSIVGTYYSNYGWHTGESATLIKIDSNHTFKYIGKTSGIWIKNKDTLYLYSPVFFHKNSYNKSISYYTDRGYDTLTAIDMSTATVKYSRQVTENDSVDIFVIRKNRLYLVAPDKKDYYEYHLQKAEDTSELNYYLRLANVDVNLNAKHKP